jgi:hypothetical protein
LKEQFKAGEFKFEINKLRHMQLNSNFLIAPQNRFRERRQNQQPHQQNPYDSYFFQKSFEKGSRSMSSGSGNSSGVQKAQKTLG